MGRAVVWGLGGVWAALKLPALWYPVKGGMALEGPHIRRKQAEADRAAAVAVVDAIDEWRQPLAAVIVGSEQIRLMHRGGNQVEQNNADTQRLVWWDPLPELCEAAEQKARCPASRGS
jgi:hypothetical protein